MDPMYFVSFEVLNYCILYNFPWLHYFIFHIVQTCNNFAIILLKYAIILHIFAKLLQNYCMFLQYEIWSNAVKENCTIYNNWLLQNWQNTLDPLLHTVNCKLFYMVNSPSIKLTLHVLGPWTHPTPGPKLP